MTMNFRTIKLALVTLLGANESGRFQTIGYQRQAKSALEVKEDSRFVQLYYRRGAFPDSSGSIAGPFKHKPFYQVDLTVSAPCKVDLATLNDENSTAQQKAAAIAARSEAADIADDSIDELFDIVFQIVMDARNRDLTLDEGDTVRLWITDFVKDDIIDRGSLVILTGGFSITCDTEETVPGDTGESYAGAGEIQDDLISVGTITTADIETEDLEDEVSQTVVRTN